MYFRQFCIDLKPDCVCSDGHQCPRVRQTHKYGAVKLVNVISDSSWKFDINKKEICTDSLPPMHACSNDVCIVNTT